MKNIQAQKKQCVTLFTSYCLSVYTSTVLTVLYIDNVHTFCMQSTIITHITFWGETNFKCMRGFYARLTSQSLVGTAVLAHKALTGMEPTAMHNSWRMLQLPLQHIRRCGTFTSRCHCWRHPGSRPTLLSHNLRQFTVCNIVFKMSLQLRDIRVASSSCSWGNTRERVYNSVEPSPLFSLRNTAVSTNAKTPYCLSDGMYTPRWCTVWPGPQRLEMLTIVLHPPISSLTKALTYIIKGVLCRNVVRHATQLSMD